MKNCIAAQSGGPTAAINASLAGILLENEKRGLFDHVYGSLNGITGILDHRFLDLTQKSEQNPDFIKNLRTTPAMYLGSCRFKLPDPVSGQAFYEAVFSFFEKMEIAAFFYIGGNDSMDTVQKLSEYAKANGKPVQIIGIPKTIDNDLCETDHTPGFGSAAKYVAATFLEIAHDAYIYPVKSVTVVEVMGRDAGWLTASSALARTSYNPAPQLIYLPERPFDAQRCIKDTKALLEKEKHVIIALSEGIRDKNGSYISTSGKTTDSFGHVKLCGAGKTVEDLISKSIDVKIRSIELNVLQRAASHLSSETDLRESEQLGEKALQLAAEGKTGCMTVLVRKSDQPYEIELSSADICGIANKVRSVPDAFIAENGSDVTEEFISYARPLIIGEPEILYKNGIPHYLDVSHLL